MKRLLLTIALLLPTLSPAQQYSISSYRIAAGGGKSTGGIYSITGTIGQADAGGWTGSNSWTVRGGFWATEVSGVRIIVPPGVTAVTNGGTVDGIVIGDGGTLTLGGIPSTPATNESAPSSPAANAVPSIALTPFKRWKITQLGNANAPDLGDQDGDGLANLAEYGLGLLPKTSDAAMQPQPRFFNYPEGWRLGVFFERNPARNDVTIEVQAADNPAGPWTTIASSVRGAQTTGPGYVKGDSETPGIKTVEVRDTVNFQDAPQRFLRFRVTR